MTHIQAKMIHSRQHKWFYEVQNPGSGKLFFQVSSKIFFINHWKYIFCGDGAPQMSQHKIFCYKKHSECQAFQSSHLCLTSFWFEYLKLDVSVKEIHTKLPFEAFVATSTQCHIIKWIYTHKSIKSACHIRYRLKMILKT